MDTYPDRRGRKARSPEDLGRPCEDVDRTRAQDLGRDAGPLRLVGDVSAESLDELAGESLEEGDAVAAHATPQGAAA